VAVKASPVIPQTRRLEKSCAHAKLATSTVSSAASQLRSTQGAARATARRGVECANSAKDALEKPSWVEIPERQRNVKKIHSNYNALQRAKFQSSTAHSRPHELACDRGVQPCLAMADEQRRCGNRGSAAAPPGARKWGALSNRHSVDQLADLRRQKRQIEKGIDQLREEHLMINDILSVFIG
jgi:hypothetical protein